MKILRNILAVILGLFIGGAVNMALVMIGPHIFPAPAGVDISTMEGLKAAMPLMKPENFIFPFLAHALGTFVGAWIAGRIAATAKKVIAMIIGICFLIGGIMNIVMLPGSPLWFTLLDLIVAYLPMAYLGGKLASRKK